MSATTDSNSRHQSQQQTQQHNRTEGFGNMVRPLEHVRLGKDAFTAVPMEMVRQLGVDHQVLVQAAPSLSSQNKSALCRPLSVTRCLQAEPIVSDVDTQPTPRGVPVFIPVPVPVPFLVLLETPAQAAAVAADMAAAFGRSVKSTTEAAAAAAPAATADSSLQDVPMTANVAATQQSAAAAA
uniref:Uncharacterized protein n=1 Tax=Macrostomum lignano TaxID=282301 RepID=A0A1I8FVU6_9PLAT